MARRWIKVEAPSSDIQHEFVNAHQDAPRPNALRSVAHCRRFLEGRRLDADACQGNRSPAARAACKQYGGFYLAWIGGTAANLAEHHIKKAETVEYAELGIEAIWRIEAENFPAFIVIDDEATISSRN